MKQINIVLCLLSIVLCLGCNPEAKYEVENVNIDIRVKAVSAGFVECDFTTDKDAYYLIAIIPAQEGINPLDHQKQFMTLALDSAYVEYLDWRHDRLEEGGHPSPATRSSTAISIISSQACGTTPNIGSMPSWWIRWL